MNLYVMNKDFEAFGVIDYYESLIWNEKYSESGDFEIYLMADSYIFSLVQDGYYIYNPSAVVQKTMYVNKLQTNTDVLDGNRLIITGFSLERLLDRRVIWPQIDFHGLLQDGIKTMLEQNAINPTDTNRKIPGLYFKYNNDEKIKGLLLDGQYAGNNLYDTISEICKNNNLGFKIILTDDNKLEFSLYAGEDRSYSQEENDYVIFSHKFDNVISSEYMESSEALKNCCYVGGTKEKTTDAYRRYTVLDRGYSGLNRRESYVDGSSVSDTSSSGRKLTAIKYDAALKAKANEDLTDKTSTKSFEEEVENGQSFTFGIHYYIGDIVQLVDEYGHEGQARVSGVVSSDETSGTNTYPTFEMITNNLPDGYTELQYVKLGGTYVDTGYKCNPNTKITCDVNIQNGAAHIFGNEEDDETFRMNLYWNSEGRLHLRFGEVEVLKDDAKKFTTNERHNWDLDSYAGKVIMDDPEDEDKTGYEYTMIATRTGMAIHNLLIGAYNRSDYMSEHVLYSFKIYDQGVLVRNFVPAKNAELVIGLFDTVNEKFYSSDTSTPLVAGPRA